MSKNLNYTKITNFAFNFLKNHYSRCVLSSNITVFLILMMAPCYPEWTITGIIRYVEERRIPCTITGNNSHKLTFSSGDMLQFIDLLAENKRVKKSYSISIIRKLAA